MKPRNYLQRSSLITGLALALALITYAPSAHANVYASNIKINGTLTGAATVAEGSGATITYILNEPASLAAAVQIFSGVNLVKTIIILGGSPGTLQGLNTVIWDGTDNSSAVVPPGNYTVQVTAESNGYNVWTQILNVSNTKIYWPSGIAVDTSINSPYYGRVMVANGTTTAQNVAPHPVGILKFNADGSEADEGQSNPGYSFRTDTALGDSVRSVKYGTDDRVYFDDWYGNGRVVACDMKLTSNQIIWDSGSSPAFASLGGGAGDIDVTDPGTTNGLVWIADSGDYPNIGVYCYPLTNNGVADSTSAGIQVITPGPIVPLRAGYGFMVDESADIFIGQVRANAGDVAQRAFCITNVWGASFGYATNWWNTQGSFPILSADLNWEVGSADNNMEDISAMAVDSRTSPTYVACAFNGGGGGVRILYATNGATAVNINQGSGNYYVGVGWDNVGNLYAGNSNTGLNEYTVFSPPDGANQATTPAVATLTVSAPPASAVTISNISGTTLSYGGGGGVRFILLTTNNITAAMSSWTPVATNPSTPGTFTIPAVGSSAGPVFYRVVSQSP